jgi:hypothetical protein
MAISVSEEFKAAMRAPVKEVRARVQTIEQTARIFTSEDGLVSLKYESVGALLGTVMNKVTVKLLGEWVLTGVDLQAEFSVKLASGEWEALNLGNFLCSESVVDHEMGMTTLTGWGMMKNASEQLYAAGEIEFPLSVGDLAGACAERLGVVLETDMSTLPNYDYVVQEDLYAKISECSFRDILTDIAGATGTMARFADNETTQALGDNRLEFLPIQAVSESWTNDNLKKLKVSEKYGPVNSLVLSRQPQEDNIAVRDEESIAANGLTELKIANNEIMDDEREVVIGPLFEALSGYFCYGFEATTEGHGWHEVGDRIDILQGEESFEGVATDVTVEMGASGFKEVVKGVVPAGTITSYERAGGVTKTLYNTEIKVDKQAQEIISMVSELMQLGKYTQENFTQVVQTISNVVTSVQNSGGNNLIKNSVGYFMGDDGLPKEWDCEVGTSLLVSASAEAQSYGSLSGNIMTLVGSTIKQRVTVATGNDAEGKPYKYSLSVRVRKGALGTGKVLVSDGVGAWELFWDVGDDPYYMEASITDITPLNNYLDVTVTGSSDSDFTVTDLMLAPGDYRSQWTQANGEYANTQVNIDINGVTVTSSTVLGSKSLQTPFQFMGYRDGNLAYRLDADAVGSKSAILSESLAMPPLKLLAMDSGWAIVDGGN